MAIRPGDQRMYDQLEQFLRVGKIRKFFVGEMRVALLSNLERWVPAFKAALDPVAFSDALRKVIAPYLSVMQDTHRLVLSLTDIGMGWATAEEQLPELEARIPRLVVGANEEEDLVRLQTWPSIFQEVFPGIVLPPSLSPAAVKKQIAAHEQAVKKLPETTAGQTYRANYANLKDLRAEGDGYFLQMHDMLDGDYGRSGEAAFKQKAEFGYDRRLRGGGQNRRQRKTDPPAGQAGATGNSGAQAGQAGAAAKTNAAAGGQAEAVSKTDAPAAQVAEVGATGKAGAPKTNT